MLREATGVEPLLHISIIEDDPDRERYIQREHFKAWCESRKLYSRFLFWDDNAVVEVANEQDGSGVVSRRIEAILIAVDAKGWNAELIPDGGKAEIKAICLKQARLFTDSTFDAAWKKAPVRMANHATYTKGR